MRVLIDMDGVLCDFVGQCIKYSKEYFGEDRITPYIPTFSQPQAINWLRRFYAYPNFFETMDPIPGAIEGIRELMQKHECFIVTAPAKKHPDAYKGKHLWLEQYIPEMINRLFITPLKYMVRGDYLIDDLPKNLNAFPSKTICYNQPYNQAPELFHKPLDYRVNNWEEINSIL